MAKKERKQEAVAAVNTVEIGVEETPLFEAEAYTSPQPDAGTDVTVMKPVGMGGPVPIVAPKHNTIQLQPIVVPLAVVPYMTQDSNVLRTDGRAQSASYASEIYDEGEATQFEAAEQKKTAKKKGRHLPRIFSLISFVLAAVTVLPFILSYFDTNMGASLKSFDIIGAITAWVKNGFSITPVTNLIYIVVAAIAAAAVIANLIGVIIGKHPRTLTAVLSFIDFGCMLGVLIWKLVDKNQTFDAANEVAFLVILVVCIVLFVLSVAFSVILNRIEDNAEHKKQSGKEI